MIGPIENTIQNTEQSSAKQLGCFFSKAQTSRQTNPQGKNARETTCSCAMLFQVGLVRTFRSLKFDRKDIFVKSISITTFSKPCRNPCARKMMQQGLMWSFQTEFGNIKHRHFFNVTDKKNKKQKKYQHKLSS